MDRPIADPDVPAVLVDGLRRTCLALPDASEERAWVGVRWRVRTRTFAHVLVVEEGWPPAYAKAAGTAGPATVLMFRAPAGDAEALRSAGPPFFAPVWRNDEVGLRLQEPVDWDEVAELVTDSYCAVAPKGLAAQVSSQR